MEAPRSAFTWSQYAHAGQQEVLRPGQARMCGLSRKMFWVVFAIILIVVGAAIGGGLAGGLSMSQKQNATQGSINSTSSQMTSILTPTSSTTGSISNSLTSSPTSILVTTPTSTATPSPGIYAIVNAASNTAIDLYLGNANANTQINGWMHFLDNGKEGESINQKWLIAAVGNGFSVIMNIGTGTYISAPKGLAPGLNPTQGDLARVLGNPGLPNDNYNMWQIKIFGDGTVAISSKVYPTKFLDLANSNAKDGTPVLLWEDNNGGRNQRWKLLPN
ncbi:ricin B lectin domain-containing protein [Tricladium varicosporioides]|nr:ricin B lectin domain-containing protein [Hymenoscyphus varicosporioides]